MAWSDRAARLGLSIAPLCRRGGCRPRESWLTRSCITPDRGASRLFLRPRKPIRDVRHPSLGGGEGAGVPNRVAVWNPSEEKAGKSV